MTLTYKVDLYIDSVKTNQHTKYPCDDVNDHVVQAIVHPHAHTRLMLYLDH